MAQHPPIIAVERVIIAVNDLGAARERWRRAGFALASEELCAGGLRCARFAAGAVTIDLCAAQDPSRLGVLAQPMSAALAAGGGIVGWTWGVPAGAGLDAPSDALLVLPGIADDSLLSAVPTGSLPGVFTAAVEISGELEQRRAELRRRCGPNPNAVDYLEHIVVMTTALDDAIEVHESLGVPCKRIREAGNGVRQAFFKLEQTVLEVVGPTRGRPGCWGLAFLSGDIAHAVARASAAGMNLTAPKPAIQGGRIARIVDPLDGVAVAFMEAAAPAPRC